MTIAPASSFRNQVFTIDTFPENPQRESHELARLDLSQDRFRLEGEIYGEKFADCQGQFTLEPGRLLLRPDAPGATDLVLGIGRRQPSDFWRGVDIPIEFNGDLGQVAWDGRQITLHQVPAPSEFHGPLTSAEQQLLGQHHFDSQRLGSFELNLEGDRSGHLQGQLAGQPLDLEGRWLSRHPMNYFLIDGSPDFLAWHNDHQHHGRGVLGGGGQPPLEHESRGVLGGGGRGGDAMEVDVIAATSGPRAEVRRVYAMEMTSILHPHSGAIIDSCESNSSFLAVSPPPSNN